MRQVNKTGGGIKHDRERQMLQGQANMTGRHEQDRDRQTREGEANETVKSKHLTGRGEQDREK